ncbi:MAG TPA: response regulator transcription factor [Pseudogracilibacillus sp.]|nr:response regulator transcription factor [Pseudogracilibacillus sp.]
MEETINIVLIDHQQLFREGVKRVLQSESSFNIVASSDNYSVVSALLDSQQIDVLLIDINILMENKEEIKEGILERSEGSKVIVLSTEGEENYVTEAVLLGVDGYLLKEMDIYSFITAIKAVHEGQSYIHPVITGPLIEGYRKLTMGEEETTVRRPTHLYTNRECEVLQLLTDGQSNRKIAETLNISEKTVKNHVSSLFKKMQVNDRTQAVVIAIKNNWVSL